MRILTQSQIQIQMLGYDISWAGFNIIEVMSSSKFTCKRVGYLAASQCFHPDSEVSILHEITCHSNFLLLETYYPIVLCASTAYHADHKYDTQGFKFTNSVWCRCSLEWSQLLYFVRFVQRSSKWYHDTSKKSSILFATETNGSNIIAFQQCSSTKPYLRMKAVLMMYKVFLRYPEALRPAFPKLKEKLEDPDPGVQSAAVNVICELARKNPKNYLSLAPIFFKLMTTSTNNWMLIKIIKLVSKTVTILRCVFRL